MTCLSTSLPTNRYRRRDLNPDTLPELEFLAPVTLPPPSPFSVPLWEGLPWSASAGNTALDGSRFRCSVILAPSSTPTRRGSCKVMVWGRGIVTPECCGALSGIPESCLNVICGRFGAWSVDQQHHLRRLAGQNRKLPSC